MLRNLNELKAYPFVQYCLSGKLNKTKIKLFVDDLNAFLSDESFREHFGFEKSEYTLREAIGIIREIIGVQKGQKKEHYDNAMAIESLERALYELKQQKEEVEKRLELFSQLNDTAGYADIDYTIEHLNREITDYRREIAKIPKGWFGRVKDKAKLKRLENEVARVSKEIEEAPVKAKPYLESLAKLKEKLGIEGEVSSATAFRLNINAHHTFADLNKKILTGELQLINVRDYGLDEAYSTFGDLFFGPAHVNLKVQEGFLNAYIRKNYFPLIKEYIPRLPAKSVMERAKSLGAVMALRVYSDERTPQWKLFRKDVLPQTTDRTYVEQTRAMRDYLNLHGFLKSDEEAECTDKRLKELEQLAQINTLEATRLLTNMLINKRHRHSFEDICYFTFLTELEDKNGTIHRINGKSYSGLFNTYDQEATNTQLIDAAGKITGYIKMGRHLCEQRGPNYDYMPINSFQSEGFGHNQGVRLVLY